MTESHASSGLVHAYVLDGKGGVAKLDWAGVAAWQPADGVLWLNLDYSTSDAQAWLEHRSGIDPIVREALLDDDPRPRAAPHGNQLLLIVRGINHGDGAAPEDMISIRGWIEPSRVVTLRRRRSRSIEAIAGELERGTGPRDTGQLVAQLAEKVVEHVSARVDTLGDGIAACEDQILTDNASVADLRTKLADLRRRAIALRRFLAPQREALAKLSIAQLPWFGTDHRARVIEVADRMTRTVEELDAARDRAAVTQEELGSRIAELTNRRIYMLSLITAVFLPLGFVCTLFSVQIGGVPLRDVPWAFWALCGAFIVGSGLQIYIFKRRGWL
jgi:zinc transporter